MICVESACPDESQLEEQHVSENGIIAKCSQKRVTNTKRNNRKNIDEKEKIHTVRNYLKNGPEVS